MLEYRNCPDCEQTPISCICSAVDAFFGNTPKPVEKKDPMRKNIPVYSLQVLVASVLLMFTGCGKHVFEGTPGKDGGSCTVTTHEGSTTIKCPDGSSETVHDGAQGPQGQVGPQGATGANGQNAVACTTVQVAGGVEVRCPDGSFTTVYNGTNGSNGSNGSNGQNGADGTLVLPVPLCPSYTTTYPSTFAEFGFCINSKLYGVFWDGHNAWWTVIPNGYYSSTSSSAPCTFTVSAGCTVTQH